MSVETLKFELTEKQTVRYKKWVEEVGAAYSTEDALLDQVTVSFTFTPYGQYIVAHTGRCEPTDGHKIVLSDFLQFE